MVSFETAVLAAALLSGSGETVLLDFYSDGCVPCRQMDPVVQELGGRGYPVRKVNVSGNPDLAAEYGVDLVPCFVMLVDGQVVDRVVGGTTFSRLERMCKMARDAMSGPPQPAGRMKAEGGRMKDEKGETGHLDSSFSPHPSSFSDPGWRLAAPGWTGPADTVAPLANDLVAATVRLRIEDPDGHSCGSGTIIDARGGEALILTCGHIFRDSKGKGRIEVDLFGPTPAERIPGHLLSYDLDRDIGLLKIRTPGPVTTARVAPPGYRVAKDDRVINVGSNNGDPPTARYSRVTALDKYTGPPNLEVAGLPVQGRSGGGLFSEDGLLIGVCNAADPSEDEGLYTALAAVDAELSRAELAFIYRSGGQSPAVEAPLVALDPPAMPRQMPRPSDLVPTTDVPTASSGNPSDRRLADPRQGLRGEEQAALEEIRRRKSQGDEVVCVIRSRSDPQAPSEIIVLNDVSPSFLDQLAGETRIRPRDQRHLTSLEIPAAAPGTSRPDAPVDLRPVARRPLLEYRAESATSTATSDGPSWQPQWRHGEPRR
ncbi:MAG: hypothetical protein A2V98_14445 [Planctomycetes bacterium RBG_16_64_12]|nr:MAG: hypothetical protein A2V98_14445 [Planctomycetes bacterium RBG_16_64_12]